MGKRRTPRKGLSGDRPIPLDPPRLAAGAGPAGHPGLFTERRTIAKNDQGPASNLHISSALRGMPS